MLVPGSGLEPESTAPKTVVLPLDDPGIPLYYRLFPYIDATPMLLKLVLNIEMIVGL